MCYFIGAAIVYFNSTDSVVDDNNKDIEYQRSYKCDDHQMLSFNEYGNKSYYFIRPTLEVSNFEVQAFDFKEDGKFANGMINYYCVFIGVGFYTYSIEPSFWLLKYTINTGGIRAISHTPTLVSIPPPPPPPPQKKKKKKKKNLCGSNLYIDHFSSCHCFSSKLCKYQGKQDSADCSWCCTGWFGSSCSHCLLDWTTSKSKTEFI